MAFGVEEAEQNSTAGVAKKKFSPKMFDTISKTVTILIITGLLTISRNNCFGQDEGEFATEFHRFFQFGFRNGGFASS